MKLSEWIKDFDDKHPEEKIRAISLQDLLKITEFDNQPERSKREDDVFIPYIACKHTITYYSFYPTQDTSNKLKALKESNQDLGEFFTVVKNGKELSYWDLSKKERIKVDSDWEENAPMRCSEHCGNTVREVQ